MNKLINKRKNSLFNKIVSAFVAFTFIVTLILPPQLVSAQVVSSAILNLPAPGTMVNPSEGYNPVIIKGMTLHPENALQFDFLVQNSDDQNVIGKEFEAESKKLIKYFLASLTTPENEMWVNLSPYESERIIPQSFGETEMGRDLLAQDYILKQLTSSLIYPEDQLGKKFWERVYSKAQELYGTTDIPVNTFNKVWIVPDKAVLFQDGENIYIIENHLKVMLEEDYTALKNNMGSKNFRLDQVKGDDAKVISGVSSEIVREILIPEIEKEVNEGKNFANLRQVFNSAVLAAWFKQNLKDSLLGKVYVDQNKVKGIDLKDKNVNQKIYEQYLEAFKKGVFNYLRDDYDPATKDVIPRKYFSGGTAVKFENIQTYDSRKKAAVPANVIAKYNQVSKDFDGAMVGVDLLDFGENAQKDAIEKVSNKVIGYGSDQAMTAENEIVSKFSIDNNKVLNSKGEVIFTLKKAIEMIKPMPIQYLSRVITELKEVYKERPMKIIGKDLLVVELGDKTSTNSEVLIGFAVFKLSESAGEFLYYKKTYPSTGSQSLVNVSEDGKSYVTKASFIDYDDEYVYVDGKNVDEIEMPNIEDTTFVALNDGMWVRYNSIDKLQIKGLLGYFDPNVLNDNEEVIKFFQNVLRQVEVRHKFFQEEYMVGRLIYDLNLTIEELQNKNWISDSRLGIRIEKEGDSFKIYNLLFKLQTNRYISRKYLSINLVESIKQLIEDQTTIIPGTEDKSVAIPFDPNVAYYDEINRGIYKVQVNPPRHPDNRGKFASKPGVKPGDCFLCRNNQPDEEAGFEIFGGKYTIFPNPNPYEKDHIVIAGREDDPNVHQQYISTQEQIEDALELVDEIAFRNSRINYNITFNSKGAANSSDHFHFQAFDMKFPIEDLKTTAIQRGNVNVGFVNGYPGNAITLESTDKDELAEQVFEIIKNLKDKDGNIIPYSLIFKGRVDSIDGEKTENTLKVFIFPRRFETPADLNKQDEDLVTTKFGIVEMGGIIIVYDADKATKEGLFTLTDAQRNIIGHKKITKEIIEKSINAASFDGNDRTYLIKNVLGVSGQEEGDILKDEGKDNAMTTMPSYIHPGQVIAPKANGRETKEEYLKEIAAMRDQFGKTRTIQDLIAEGLRYEMTEEQFVKYKNAIKATLRKHRVKTVTPELLYEAAEQATSGDRSDIEAKIAIQPGTMNPLTYGHITASLAGILSEKLDGVLLANGGTVPDKLFSASAELRNEMARKATENKELRDYIGVTSVRDQVTRMYRKDDIEAGGNEDAYRFNMDMAAFIWVFVANPKVKWTYLVGGDKVAGYGKKDEKGLILETLSDPRSHAKVVYNDRTGDNKLNYYKDIKPYDWMVKKWNGGFFIPAKVSSFPDISATKVRKALVLKENIDENGQLRDVDNQLVTDAIPSEVYDYINNVKELIYLFSLDMRKDEIEKELDPTEAEEEYLSYIEQKDYKTAREVFFDTLDPNKYLRIRSKYLSLVKEIEDYIDNKIERESEIPVLEQIKGIFNKRIDVLGDMVEFLKFSLSERDISRLDYRVKGDLIKLLPLAFFDMHEKFLLFSGAPGSGKGAINDSTFKSKKKFKDIVDKLLLYHTRHYRVGETDGEKYHFAYINVGENDNRLFAVVDKNGVVHAYINKQGQGFVPTTFTEEITLRKAVTTGIIEKSRFFDMDFIAGTDLDPSNKNGIWQEIPSTESVRLKPDAIIDQEYVKQIAKDKFDDFWGILKNAKDGELEDRLYEDHRLLPGDRIISRNGVKLEEEELFNGKEAQKIDDDEVVVKRKIKGFDEVKRNNKVTTLEGGFAWFLQISKEFPDIFTIFVSPFKDKQIELRSDNQKIIEKMYPNDSFKRFLAYSFTNKLRKEENTEWVDLSIEEHRSFVKQKVDDWLDKWEGKNLSAEEEKEAVIELGRNELDQIDAIKANAELIESNDFIDEIVYFINTYLATLKDSKKKPLLSSSVIDQMIKAVKENPSRVRALAYELQMKIVKDVKRGDTSFELKVPKQGGSAEKTGKFSKTEDMFNRIVEGIVQILTKNQYLRNGKGHIVINRFEFQEEKVPDALAKVEKDFADAYFDYLLNAVLRNIKDPQGNDKSMLGKKGESIDNALTSKVKFDKAPGGIDLDPKLLDLQIKRDEHGAPLPVFQQPIEQMNIQGFIPVIINITPITSLPILIGFDDKGKEKKASNSELGFESMDKKALLELSQVN